MKTLKEISKTGIPDTKWCSEEDVKKMFDDYNEKLQKELGHKSINKRRTNKQIIEQVSKEVLGE